MGLLGQREFADGGVVIPVEVLQEKFLDSGLTAVELAQRLGWTRDHGRRADGERVRRYLGLIQQPGGKGRVAKYKVRMYDSTALEIAEALGLDPVDIGL